MLSAEQRSFLEAHRVAHLATADAAGRPHLVPVCFALLDGAIYTPLDAKPKQVPLERLRRVRDLAANPAVCLTVDDYDEDWRRLRWLQVRGRAELLLPGEAQAAAIAALCARYAQYRAMPMAQAPVIRIAPERVVDWRWPSIED